MPTNTERTVNAKIGECLRGKHPAWTVGAEQTGVFVEKMKQPDIVVSNIGGLTVVMETEFAPAASVESDARARLGRTVRATGERVEQCVALRLPGALRRVPQEDLEGAVEEARYGYAIFTYAGDEELFEQIERWPRRGWLEGGLDDVADCIDTVALSERRVARGVRILELAVRQAAGLLEFSSPEFVLPRLAAKLHQEPEEQTYRMVAAILANAVIFHMRLARTHPGIRDLASCKSEHGIFIKGDVLDRWREILNINYWPIFHLASDLLNILMEREAQLVIKRLDRMASELQHFGAADIQDLSGRMFQQLIADRKFLATFYTLPASATLLAELAISRLKTDWAAPDQITALRIADLACGTGALLGAAYHALAARYRRMGGHDGKLHAMMMEQVLTAADIMPSAVHLTAATLSGMHPDIPFGHTRVINMPYGEKENGDGVSIGSLDLIETGEIRSLFGTGRKALSGTGALGGDDEVTMVDMPHGSMDLVIMNPPFTRPTNHEVTGVPVPSFAGFSTRKEEQLKMSVRLKELRKGLDSPAGHGNAGLASNFIDLAHIKLRPGGILAIVLPASFTQGQAWSDARALIRRHYCDILVVGIMTDGSTDRAFSADTGMAEVLLVAKRKEDPTDKPGETLVANLRCRPKALLEAVVVARAIEQIRVRNNEDAGAIRLTRQKTAGNFLRRVGWNGIGIGEAALAVFMQSLAAGGLLLPRMPSTVSLPLSELGQLGDRGPLHRDINGMTRSGEARGPFDIEDLSASPEYPVLWKHDANRERQLIVAPDRQGRTRTGCRRQAAQLWQSGAARLHFNLDFQLNAQSLAACLTRQPSLGGRAWPSFVTEEKWEIPIVLWANTTLGLIAFWWAGTRQQQGRANMTITRLPHLVSLDAAKLSDRQLNMSRRIFEDFQGQEFLPANEAYRDEVRKSLDAAVLTGMLGLHEDVLESLSILREQWCAEPSVHGGKGTRPGSSRQSSS